MRLKIIFWSGLILCFLLTAVNVALFFNGRQSVVLEQWTQNEVSVKIACQKDPQGQLWLTAEFTPTRSGYHLYSQDLPLEGINGLGRPTRLEVISARGLQASGPAEASAQPIEMVVKPSNIRFPVYPDGSVSLKMPLKVTPASLHSAEISVTYMACSSSICLAPVINRRVNITLPDSLTQ